uniref:GPI inositol-deacylase n=1 Tax=Ananas comosus var. bracteatus TaxID=296719 RepID=A0A6V7Q922_ANACO|nr:unnamed protein product [Ananas comosus var. bracteatus]
MTYMYPTYIPIATPANVSSDKYGLFLYHEGWKQIDFAEHIKKISGVPVRSLAAESFRAYQGGPLEPTFYQEASIYPNDLADFTIPAQYSRELDWFAVDLEGEHSAMDGQILEEHTEYVVYAIHRILDQYQESRKAQLKDGVETSVSLPTSVILVGHSMGGFVARAAIAHPHLRKSAVETIITLSSPHQSPPVALQPSLGHFFSKVNGEWRQGYEKHSSQTSSPKLSNVIVVSVSGGIHDYQVRSKLASLDGIVPSSHGFTIGSSGMKNVWLSMEHQTILWCNQLVVQMSHSILSMIDPTTGQPFSSTQKRLFVFTRMLQSAIPQALSWTGHAGPSSPSSNVPIEDRKDTAESQKQGSFSCPSSVHWADNGPEKDLYIQSNSVTVLAMDGRRRWLDIKKLGSNGRGHFVFVTNLAPCSGVRIHLWPEKSNSSLVNEAPASKRIIEVTSKMVQIPAGPAPRQVEPGSQTEQPPPSAFLLLGPEEMSGFRFLTIAVAPRPSASPAASMAVGQFFNPKEGEREFSFAVLLRSSYVPEVSLCKLRCFPPVALAWDSVSGLHVIPNIYSETITVDSLPAIWDFNNGPEKTIVLLLADPHCSYRLGISVSSTAAASRFFLLYSPQIIGFMIAAMFFALMRQAYAWELDSSVPSILSALEFNLRIPQPFLLLYFLPILLSLAFPSSQHSSSSFFRKLSLCLLGLLPELQMDV